MAYSRHEYPASWDDDGETCPRCGEYFSEKEFEDDFQELDGELVCHNCWELGRHEE
jgi:formylmethanofuran dehydrogenase subunit E